MASNRIVSSRHHARFNSSFAPPLVREASALLSMGIGPWVYVLTALCLVSLLAFAHLGQASFVANQVEEMENLERELQVLKQQNNALRLQIAHSERMERIVQQAQSLGLGKPEHIEYVEAPLSELHFPEGDNRTDKGGPSYATILGQVPRWLLGALGQFADWVQTARLQPGQ
jgi:hypothetical protein